MEPTIYKPSIYKGAGIYKIGSEGGGGGGDLVLLKGTSGNYNNTTWPLNRELWPNRVCALPIYVDIGDFVKIEIDSNFEYAICCGSGDGQGWEIPDWINGVYTFTADYNFVTVSIRKLDNSNITPNDILFAKYSVN